MKPESLTLSLTVAFVRWQCVSPFTIPSFASSSSRSSSRSSTKCRLHRHQALSRYRSQQQIQTSTAIWGVTPTSCENEMEDSQNATAPRLSDPPFPPEAYNLLQDEKMIQHNFISFIDHFDEPYNQVARLIEPRAYAKPEQFDKDLNNNQTESNTVNYSRMDPTIEDLACPTSLYGPVGTFLSWNGLPARIVVGTMAYFLFPIIINILESLAAVDYVSPPQDGSFWERFQTMIDPSTHAEAVSNLVQVSITEEERQNLASLVNLYIPGVSIVLGTYFSMTLGILYDRFSRIQQTITQEASMLAYCFQVLLDLFSKDRNNLIPACQCIADQIHVLIRDSRGKESMRIIYNDPYANILRIVQRYSRQPNSCSAQDATLVGVVRDCIRQLYELRSKRMSDEALGLAPTHFDVMTFLSGLLLLGIALGTVATAQTNGVPTELSRVLFAALVVCYTTIYEMSYDLNRPFDGVYQLRRSGAAMHFLQIKHMVASHPVLRNHITFDPEDDSVMNGDDEGKDNFTESTTNGDREAAYSKRRKEEIWYN